MYKRRPSLKKESFTFLKRSFCSIKNGFNFNIGNPVVVEESRNSRTVILNRPHALNALSTPMGVRLTELYESWEKDPNVAFVVMKGNGRAFCSGGDVVKLYQLITQGKFEECKDCFRTFYRFMHLLATYSKPNVFCVPEILIGHHPDAGASYYLSHLPGYLGEYLGLTADKLSGEEMYNCGLATHFSLSKKLPLMENQLGKFSSPSFSAMKNFLDSHSHHSHLNHPNLLHRVDLINKCFGHGTVEEIINSLEREAKIRKDEWCISTVRKLKEAPPLSLKISLRSIREGRYQSLEECLAREYKITLRTISSQISNNFCQGVRARLVDKSLTPKWDPPSLEQVSEDMVEAYFAPPNAYEPDLDLPTTKLREASLIM
ncbi:3-hydroxyisobutyryl-CoA hydrolase-like protein 1, mitochondrial isoform X2 [Euphorbia lathyris]|uniref:3-hydroxyisobutyryl-CoA hydrolase-like protein 1, mitochondrial isoform X2 n=1 Tax=Euphorbia lathyris TaxID=212925 RepID=UPI0033140476